MLAQELFLNNDVGMGNFVSLQLAKPLVITPLVQKLAVEGTGNRLFSLLAAALRTNIRP